jgi:hypothetical protein
MPFIIKSPNEICFLAQNVMPQNHCRFHSLQGPSGSLYIPFLQRVCEFLPFNGNPLLTPSSPESIQYLRAVYVCLTSPVPLPAARTYHSLRRIYVCPSNSRRLSFPDSGDRL